MGCVLTKLLGSPEDLCPTFVDLMQGRPMVRDSARPGFLGPPFQPFRPDISEMFSRPLEKGMKNELAAAGGDRSSQLKLIGGISADRITDRTSLLNYLDQVRRRLDNSDEIHAMDRFQQQALSTLSGDHSRPRITPFENRCRRFQHKLALGLGCTVAGQAVLAKQRQNLLAEINLLGPLQISYLDGLLSHQQGRAEGGQQQRCDNS